MLFPVLRTPLEAALQPLVGSLRRTAAAPAVMPEGALGIWYADQFDADTNTIPNAATETPVSTAINRAPRRLFATASFWNATGGTVTENTAVGPNGLQQAATVSLTASQYLFMFDPGDSQVRIRAGTYSLCASVKRNAETDQNFKMGGYPGLGASEVFTATSAWQRFKYTFTLGADSTENIYALLTDGATTLDVFLDNVEIFPGSEDLGASVEAGHLYLGRSAHEAAPGLLYADGELDLSGGVKSLIQYPATSLETFTSIALVKKTAAGGDYQLFLATHAFGELDAYFEQAHAIAAAWSGATYTSNAQPDEPYDLDGDGYHAIGHRFDGTNLEIWFDDLRLFSRAIGAQDAVAIANMWFGGLGALGSAYSFSGGAFWGSDITDAEMRTAYAVLVARAAESGITATVAPQRVFVPEGDSITAVATSWVDKLKPNHSTKTYTATRATSGSFLDTLEARAAITDAIIPPTPGAREFVMTVHIGANDLQTADRDMTAWMADLAAYCDARRAAGWSLAICTVLPSTNASITAKRGAVNTELRTWVGVHADGLIDFAADATIGVDAAAADTDYYSDGLHPTDATYVIMETIARPVVNAL